MTAGKKWHSHVNSARSKVLVESVEDGRGCSVDDECINEVVDYAYAFHPLFIRSHDMRYDIHSPKGEIEMVEMTATPARRIAAGISGVGVAVAIILGAGPAHADPIDDPQSCLADRPCIIDMHDLVNDGIYVEWDPQGSYDKIHFSWARAGGPWHPNEFSANFKPVFVVHSARKNTEYFFSMQGCESVLIGKDNCSPFEETSFVTNGI